MGGSVHPKTAIVVAAGEWVWTIAPTSGRRAYTSVCSGSSLVGSRRPATTSPSVVTSGMSSGSRASYG